MHFQSDRKRILLRYKTKPNVKLFIPNTITSLRLIALPHLVYSFNHEITIAAYALFLFSIGTDLADGYASRKLKLASKFGAYFDIIVDFLFISGMYVAFINNGLYSPWILPIIGIVFVQFILTNLYMKRTVYDPFGKYYGSLLFGGIGLTLLFSEPIVYTIVTIGIVVVSSVSIFSRLIYFFKDAKQS